MNNEAASPYAVSQTPGLGWSCNPPPALQPSLMASEACTRVCLLAFLRLLFVVKGQKKEGGRVNELREIGKGRGEVGVHRKKIKLFLCVSGTVS